MPTPTPSSAHATSPRPEVHLWPFPPMPPSQPFTQAASLLWQGPALYWQTVGQIMAGRSRAVDQLVQLQQHACQQLHGVACHAATAQNPAQNPAQNLADLGTQVAEICLEAQQQTLLLVTQLQLDTHQQRAVLASQLRQLMTAATAQLAQPVVAPAAHVAPQPASLHPTPPTFRVQVPTAPREPLILTPQDPRPARKSGPETAAPQAPQAHASANQDTPATPPAANAAATVTSLSPVRENGVMRSSTGATVAAAAAARRSVVARRSQRRSKLARGIR